MPCCCSRPCQPWIARKASKALLAYASKEDQRGDTKLKVGRCSGLVDWPKQPMWCLRPKRWLRTRMRVALSNYGHIGWWHWVCPSPIINLLTCAVAKVWFLDTGLHALSGSTGSRAVLTAFPQRQVRPVPGSAVEAKAEARQDGLMAG